MNVFLVYKGKRIDILNAERYRNYAEVNGIPRKDEIVRVRTVSEKPVEDKGYEVFDLEYKVTDVIYDYPKKAILVKVDRTGIEKTYIPVEDDKKDEKKKT